jgi:hypothetical protein
MGEFSAIHGLSTALGKYWEDLAIGLAEQNGFTIHSQHEMKEVAKLPKQCPSHIMDLVNEIIHDRENWHGKYSPSETKEAVREACQHFVARPPQAWEKPGVGEGIDVWIEKDGIHYITDSKTVQPNLGGLKSFMKRIIHWYLAFFSHHPNSQLEAFVFFPFNPYPNIDFWEGTIGGGKPLSHPEEARCEDEFWDFITGNVGSFDSIKRGFSSDKVLQASDSYFQQCSQEYLP